MVRFYNGFRPGYDPYGLGGGPTPYWHIEIWPGMKIKGTKEYLTLKGFAYRSSVSHAHAVHMLKRCERGFLSYEQCNMSDLQDLYVQ